MKGYSKINLMNINTKSRSTDFSDQTIQTPRFEKPISITNSPKHPDHNDDEDEDYKQYSVAATSISTTTNAKGTSNRFKIEKQNSTGRTLQTAMKRAFSIKRSSSVSERYSRIHDQRFSNPFDNDYEQQKEEENEFQIYNKMKKQNRGSIFKACKRVFGL